MSSEPHTPVIGDWIIIRRWGLEHRQITKVTDKMFKLGAGSSRYPTQISKSDKDIVAAVSGAEKDVNNLRDAIAGVDGEYKRRCSLADEERNQRTKAAREARDAQVDRLLAARKEASNAD